MLRHAVRSAQAFLSGRRLSARRDAAGGYDAGPIAARRSWRAARPESARAAATLLADAGHRTPEYLGNAAGRGRPRQRLRAGRTTTWKASCRCCRSKRLLEQLRAGVLKYEALLGRPTVRLRSPPGRTVAGAAATARQVGLSGRIALHARRRQVSARPAKQDALGRARNQRDRHLARVPADAAKPETFLAFSRLLSDSMDTDHVATVAFAHWPSHASPWYDVLRRIAELSPVLGKFMLLDDYFMHTDMPGRLSKFAADDYRTPYLKQAIIRRQTDPISTFVRRTCSAQREAPLVRAVSTVCATARRRSRPATTDAAKLPWPQLARLIARAAASRPRRGIWSSIRSFPRRRSASNFPRLASLPARGGPVVAAGASGGRKFAVVDVPSLGFAWIEAGESPAVRAREKPIVDENIRCVTNSSRSTSAARPAASSRCTTYRQRGNQLSQQLACRARRRRRRALAYTTMRAEASTSRPIARPTARSSAAACSSTPPSRRWRRFRQTCQACGPAAGSWRSTSNCRTSGRAAGRSLELLLRGSIRLARRKRRALSRRFVGPPEDDGRPARGARVHRHRQRGRHA